MFEGFPITKLVLVLRSAPNAVGSQDYDVSNISTIVAINNAWRIRSVWTHLVHAGDFPAARRPNARPGQTVPSHEAYIPANNTFEVRDGYWGARSQPLSPTRRVLRSRRMMPFSRYL